MCIILWISCHSKVGLAEGGFYENIKEVCGLNWFEKIQVLHKGAHGMKFFFYFFNIILIYLKKKEDNLILILYSLLKEFTINVLKYTFYKKYQALSWAKLSEYKPMLAWLKFNSSCYQTFIIKNWVNVTTARKINFRVNFIFFNALYRNIKMSLTFSKFTVVSKFFLNFSIIYTPTKHLIS